MDSCNLSEKNILDLTDQDLELKALGISVFDQKTLEDNVEAAVNKAALHHERKQKLQIVRTDLKNVEKSIKNVEIKKIIIKNKLEGMKTKFFDPRLYLSLERELGEKDKELQNFCLQKKKYAEKLKAVESNECELDKIDLEEGEIIDSGEDSRSNIIAQNEDLIKMGDMTPFGSFLPEQKLNSRPESGITLLGSDEFYSRENGSGILARNLSEGSQVARPKKVLQNKKFQDYLLDQINKQKEISGKLNTKSKNSSPNFKKRKKLIELSFDDASFSNCTSFSSLQVFSEKNKLHNIKVANKALKSSILFPKKRKIVKVSGTVTSHKFDKFKKTGKLLSEGMPLHDEESADSEYLPSESEVLSDDCAEFEIKCNKLASKGKKDAFGFSLENKKGKRAKDDGNIDHYKLRLKKYYLEKKHEGLIAGDDSSSYFDEDESDFEDLGGGYKVPLTIWNKLYRYQKTCVKWLWELHCQGCGGILGDEMGLGKTIQVIVFLAGLHFSDLYSNFTETKGLGPVLIVAPATVLHQWVKEFHKWWPSFRVAVLHESGSYAGNRSTLIHNINKNTGVLITSYTGVRDQIETLLQYFWHYVILDEGHKIRNPEAQVTVAVKRFTTPHRLILSGSPIQNSLKELWSLFDFIFPGKLGTLPVFLQSFAVPITQGGYASATKIEVQTAYRCASVLKDTISPYLLRRLKKDVNSHLNLPGKNEQVLFCSLTDVQKEVYRNYLDGDHVKLIFKGRLQVFVGLINLRKICNHPDLVTGGSKNFDIDDDPQSSGQYGWWEKSGKMQVLHVVLRIWSKQGHRVLLFTQSRQMMCILENYIIQQNYLYLKMDGTTAVGSRQHLIDKFNSNPSYFVFLLTTRVGGLGINLTGADRVVIYDPDWNPSTDLQARERAWRIGQMRHVTIYRLLTSGTIEEKIYHRQIFKQFITNRVLKDPKQQRFFKTNDLYELFTFHDGLKEKTETSVLFAGTGSEIHVKKAKKNKIIEKRKAENTIDAERIEHMKKLAKALAKKIGKNVDEKSQKDHLKISNVECEKLDHPLSSDDGKSLEPMSKPLSSTEKKIKKGRRFEGERVEYLVKKRQYKHSDEDKKEVNKSQDEYVLNKLFTKSGVHTALNHDKIVESNDSDFLLVESEAEKVAKEALKAVKESQALCTKLHERKQFGSKMNAQLFVTKEKEAPGNRKNNEILCYVNASESSSGVLSSAQLLTRMRQRNNNCSESEESEEEDSQIETAFDTFAFRNALNSELPLSAECREALELLCDIRNFIAFQSENSGQASTSEIINRFEHRVPNKAAHVFKALLQQICNFSRLSTKKGVWFLKDEYR